MTYIPITTRLKKEPSLADEFKKFCQPEVTAQQVGAWLQGKTGHHYTASQIREARKTFKCPAQHGGRRPVGKMTPGAVNVRRGRFV